MASIMKSANRLQKALTSGSGVSFGAWQMFPGTNLSRFIARAGFDWVCVDCEHGNMAGTGSSNYVSEYCSAVIGLLLLRTSADVSTFLITDAQMHESVAAIASCGVSPIVRIPDNQGWTVKRALDSGAHGIVVPLLYTADDARKLVQSAKFPPVGQRGYGSPFSMGMFDVQGGMSGLQYLQQSNESLITIVQIETREAFENVDAIAKVDGIDVLLVGPYDLGNNLGHPVTGDFALELKTAIETIRKAAASAGKKSGIYATSGEQARAYADQGFNMISVMADVVAVPTFMSDSLKTAKGGYGHAALQAVKGGASWTANMVSGKSDDKPKPGYG